MAQKKALEELRYYRMNNQVCIVKQLVLEQILIFQKAYEVKKLDLRQATDVYYHSKLAGQISQGIYGIENMDYKYLVQDMIENEKELFFSKTDQP